VQAEVEELRRQLHVEVRVCACTSRKQAARIRSPEVKTAAERRAAREETALPKLTCLILSRFAPERL
jgi:hypothetical protein